MATSDDTLDILLNRATDPSLKEEDWDKIRAFCDKVNTELEGPLLSTRLIAHKIQSPQEKEASYALTTLETCVRECGRYFHQEIGKFRFLNEMIKVVSPKYLGNRSSESVKKRCIEILYCWQKGLTHEPKIAEAYQMLKSQGIIKEDPTYMDKNYSPFPPLKPRKADFEDDEKAKTLDRLLKSKNPEDLQAANRMIKNMVKEDMEKSERRSRRINELESVGNQVKLLSEMIAQYSTSSSKGELEMMKELFDNLEKQRPNLFRLASDTDENDNEGINDILKANDSVTRVMTLYKERVEGEAPAGDYSAGAKDSSLLELESGSNLNRAAANPTGPQSGSAAILENDFKMLGLGDMNELGSIFNNVSTQQQQSASMGAPNQMGQPLGGGAAQAFGQPGPFSGLSSVAWTQGGASGPPSGALPPAYSAISHNIRPTPATSEGQSTNPFQPAMAGQTGMSSTPAKPNPSASSALADLDILDKSLQAHNLNKETFPSKAPPTKLPLNQMAASKAAATSASVIPAMTMSQPITATDLLTGGGPSLVPTLAPTSSQPPIATPAPATNTQASSATNGGDFTEMVSAAPEPVPELLPLTDVFVPLESIQPAPNIPSVTAYDKNSVKVVVHFAKDRPRADVITMVVSTLSTNTSPITGFVFQAAVPKVMKVKLQPPSASDFPAYNPILPPAAITQVMLIANPRKEKVRLKYKLSYNLDGKQISDVGDIDGIPVQ